MDGLSGTASLYVRVDGDKVLDGGIGGSANWGDNSAEAAKTVIADGNERFYKKTVLDWDRDKETTTAARRRSTSASTARRSWTAALREARIGTKDYEWEGTLTITSDDARGSTRP